MDAKEALDSKRSLFLDLYIANGLNPSKKVECYRLAYSEETDGVQDNSCATYAKKILATKQAKDYIQERRVTNSAVSLQLMEALRYLDKMLKERNLKPYEEINVLKERRQHISDLSKIIEIVRPINSYEDEYLISDISFHLYGGENIKNIKPEEALQVLKNLNGSILSIDESGNLKQLIPMINGVKQKVMKEAVQAGKYRICIKKNDLLAEEMEF